LRLRKKAKKDGSLMTDPSVQRLVDQSSRDLNSQFRKLFDQEKKCLRQVLNEDRHRFCNFVACLKPVIDEELGMLSELGQIEDVMHKLGRVATNPDILPEAADAVIDDASFEAGGSLCFATPPSTPSMGSRKSSMCSIASIASSTRPQSEASNHNGQAMSPSRSSITSVDLVARHRSFNQHDFASLRRSNGGQRMSSYNSDSGYPASMSAASDSRPNSALSASVSYKKISAVNIDYGIVYTGCPITHGIHCKKSVSVSV
jgi:hypothetical protein